MEQPTNEEIQQELAKLNAIEARAERERVMDEYFATKLWFHQRGIDLWYESNRHSWRLATPEESAVMRKPQEGTIMHLPGETWNIRP